MSLPLFYSSLPYGWTASRAGPRPRNARGPGFLLANHIAGPRRGPAKACVRAVAGNIRGGNSRRTGAGKIPGEQQRPDGTKGAVRPLRMLLRLLLLGCRAEGHVQFLL